MKIQRTLTLAGTVLSIQVNEVHGLPPVDHTIKPTKTSGTWHFTNIFGLAPIECSEFDKMLVTYIEMTEPSSTFDVGTECDLILCSSGSRYTGEILFLSDTWIVFLVDGKEHMFDVRNVQFEPTISEKQRKIKSLMDAVRLDLPKSVSTSGYEYQERILRRVVECVVNQNGE